MNSIAQTDKKNVKTLVDARYSCRTYEKKFLDDKILSSIKEFINSMGPGPFGNSPRFDVVAASENDTAALKDLGTYGFIKNTPAYLVGAIEKKPGSDEDYGYLMEKVLLHFTDIGLGSCWLGGSFTKSTFAERISVKSEEYVPAVAAVGHIAQKPRLIDGVIRFGVGAKKRKPWEDIFFNGNDETPLTMNDAGVFKVPLEMLRLAPSASNKQPWRIVKEKGSDTYHFFLTRTKGYDKQIKRWKMADLQRVDMGIAMSHFEMACKEMKLKGTWIEEEPGEDLFSSETEYVITWKV